MRGNEDDCFKSADADDHHRLKIFALMLMLIMIMLLMIIIIMSLFLKRFSMLNMLNCAVQCK